MSEIRYNRLDDNYVIIAPERLHKPDSMAWTKKESDLEACPFCEGRESLTPSEIYALRDKDSYADEKGWACRVVPNLFKAVQIEASHGSRQVGANEVWEGFGAHEIIIDMPNHLMTMSQWPLKSYVNWFKTLQHRIKDLRDDQRIKYITIFKNHGPFAGATQSHPHTQLIGLPVLPKEVDRKYNRIYEHYNRHGRVLFDDILADEERDQSRIVLLSEEFIAFCPFASSYPFEVVIAAKKSIGAFEHIKARDIDEISELLKDIFYRMEQVLGDFDFNLSFSLPPMQKRFENDYFFNHIEHLCRFSIRIIPRIYRQGAFELTTATIINPVEPERSAELLRGVSEKEH